MYFPPNPPFVFQQAGIWWTEYEGLSPGDLSKKFRMNFDGAQQEGPLQITFNKSVRDFTLTLQGTISAGHYMVAFDSAGAQLDSVDFEPASGNPGLSEKTLAVTRIRKVIVYPLVLGHSPDGITEVQKDRLFCFVCS
jgi:hypothetical protein